MTEEENLSLGRICSAHISHAEALFLDSHIDEARFLMSHARGQMELYRENPDMMSLWEADEIAEIHQAWRDLCATYDRISLSGISGHHSGNETALSHQ